MNGLFCAFAFNTRCDPGQIVHTRLPQKYGGARSQLTINNALNVLVGRKGKLLLMYCEHTLFIVCTY